MSDGMHWYDKDGTPRHQVPNAKGDGLRNTTITDAKKRGLFPSVSGITKMLSAPGLEIYKMREVAKQCYLSPPYAGEEMDEYISSMLEKGKDDSKQAMDAGTTIHKAMEQWLTSGTYDEVTVQVNGETKAVGDFVIPAVEALKGWEFVATEKVLVNQPEGYAGTTDLIAKGPHGQRAIIDFKSKRTKPGKKIEPLESHRMQLAAYSQAYWQGQGNFWANLYISTTEPGRVQLLSYTADDMAASWRAFLCCRDLWIYSTGYDPRTTN